MYSRPYSVASGHRKATSPVKTQAGPSSRKAMDRPSAIGSTRTVSSGRRISCHSMRQEAASTTVSTQIPLERAVRNRSSGSSRPPASGINSVIKNSMLFPFLTEAYRRSG